MANKLDNEVVLEAVQGTVVFRDFVTGADKLQFYFYATDPNLVLTAPIGSLVSGASGTWQNTDGGTTWVLLGGGGGSSPFVATNEWYVDNTIVDSPANAALRIFSLIELAMADLDAVLPPTMAYVVRLRESQTHLWTGTNFPTTRFGTIYAMGGDLVTSIDIFGDLFLDPGPVSLLLRNVTVTASGAAIANSANNDITFDYAYLTGIDAWTGTGMMAAYEDSLIDGVAVTMSSFNAFDAFIGNPRFVVPSVTLTGCQIDDSGSGGVVFFDGVLDFTATDVVLATTNPDFTFLQCDAVAGAATATVRQMTMDINNPAEASGFVLFAIGTGSGIYENLHINCNNSSPGVLDFGVATQTQACDILVTMPWGVAPLLNLPTGAKFVTHGVGEGGSNGEVVLAPSFTDVVYLTFPIHNSNTEDDMLAPGLVTGFALIPELFAGARIEIDFEGTVACAAGTTFTARVRVGGTVFLATAAVEVAAGKFGGQLRIGCTNILAGTASVQALGTYFDPVASAVTGLTPKGTMAEGGIAAVGSTVQITGQFSVNDISSARIDYARIKYIAEGPLL